MTEERTPDEEALEDEAREVADEPDEPVEGSETLPDEVADGEVEE